MPFGISQSKSRAGRCAVHRVNRQRFRRNGLDSCFRRPSSECLEDREGEDSAIEIARAAVPLARRGSKAILNGCFKARPSRPPLIYIFEKHPFESDPVEGEFEAPLLRPRSFKGLAFEELETYIPPFASDNVDTIPSMSSFSGAAAIVLPPQALPKGLGWNSIQDTRLSMEALFQHTHYSSSNGARIPRSKVLDALFTLADSLEDLELREMVRHEVSGLAKSRPVQQQKHNFPDPLSEMEALNDTDWGVNRVSRRQRLSDVENISAGVGLSIQPLSLLSSVGTTCVIVKDGDQQHSEPVKPQEAQPISLISQKLTMKVKPYPLKLVPSADESPSTHSSRSGDTYGAGTLPPTNSSLDRSSGPRRVIDKFLSSRWDPADEGNLDEASSPGLDSILLYQPTKITVLRQKQIKQKDALAPEKHKQDFPDPFPEMEALNDTDWGVKGRNPSFSTNRRKSK